MDNEVNKNVEKNTNDNKKKIIMFSAIGGGALIILIILGIVLASIFSGKPSKKKAQDLVKTASWQLLYCWPQ